MALFENKPHGPFGSQLDALRGPPWFADQRKKWHGQLVGAAMLEVGKKTKMKLRSSRQNNTETITFQEKPHCEEVPKYNQRCPECGNCSPECQSLAVNWNDHVNWPGSHFRIVFPFSKKVDK